MLLRTVARRAASVALGGVCIPLWPLLTAVSAIAHPRFPSSQLVPRVVQRCSSALLRHVLAALATSKALALAAPAQFRTILLWRRFMPIYVAYMWTDTRNKLRSPEAQQRAWDARHEWGGIRVHAMVLELSGYCVKLSQVLATKTEFMPQQWTRRLCKLFDSMPPHPWPGVRSSIESHLAACPLANPDATLPAGVAAEASASNGSAFQGAASSRRSSATGGRSSDGGVSSNGAACSGSSRIGSSGSDGGGSHGRPANGATPAAAVAAAAAPLAMLQALDGTPEGSARDGWGGEGKGCRAPLGAPLAPRGGPLLPLRRPAKLRRVGSAAAATAAAAAAAAGGALPAVHDATTAAAVAAAMAVPSSCASAAPGTCTGMCCRPAGATAAGTCGSGPAATAQRCGDGAPWLQQRQQHEREFQHREGHQQQQQQEQQPRQAGQLQLPTITTSGHSCVRANGVSGAGSTSGGSGASRELAPAASTVFCLATSAHGALPPDVACSTTSVLTRRTAASASSTSTSTSSPSAGASLGSTSSTSSTTATADSAITCSGPNAGSSLGSTSSTGSTTATADITRSSPSAGSGADRAQSRCRNGAPAGPAGTPVLWYSDACVQDGDAVAQGARERGVGKQEWLNAARAARSRVEAGELPRRMRRYLEWVEAEALASASIAQVHRARLSQHVLERVDPFWRDHAEVVLKVQHKKMQRLMTVDLANAGRLASFIRGVLPFDPVPVVQELQAAVPREFDFEREGQLTTAIRERLEEAGLSPGGVVVPRVLRALSTPRLLVLEQMEGIPFTALLAQVAAGDTALLAAAREAVTKLVVAHGHMILREGVFHADPHPGNLLLQVQDARCVLLDFGQCKALTVDQQLQLCRLVGALAAGEPLPIALAMLALGLSFGPPKGGPPRGRGSGAPAGASCMRADAAPASDGHGRSRTGACGAGNGVAGDGGAGGGDVDGALDLEAVAAVAYVMFDTRSMEEARLSPFMDNPVLRQAPITTLPPFIWMFLRSVMLLRGLCHALHMDIHSADVWAPLAAATLAAPDSALRAAQRRAQFV